MDFTTILSIFSLPSLPPSAAHTHKLIGEIASLSNGYYTFLRLLRHFFQVCDNRNCLAMRECFDKKHLFVTIIFQSLAEYFFLSKISSRFFRRNCNEYFPNRTPLTGSSKSCKKYLGIFRTFLEIRQC